MGSSPTEAEPADEGLSNSKPLDKTVPKIELHA